MERPDRAASRTPALPKAAEHGPPPTLREQPSRPSQVVRHGRYITLEPAEAGPSRSLFDKIPGPISGPRPAQSRADMSRRFARDRDAAPGWPREK